MAECIHWAVWALCNLSGLDSKYMGVRVKASNALKYVWVKVVVVGLPLLLGWRYGANSNPGSRHQPN